MTQTTQTRLSPAVRKFPKAGWEAIAAATDKIVEATRKDSHLTTMTCQIAHIHNEFERYIEKRFPPGSKVTASVSPEDVTRRKLMTAIVSVHQRPASQLADFGLIVEMTDEECSELESYRDCGRCPQSGKRLIRWGWWEIEKAITG